MPPIKPVRKLGSSESWPRSPVTSPSSDGMIESAVPPSMHCVRPPRAPRRPLSVATGFPPSRLPSSWSVPAVVTIAVESSQQ